MNTRTARESDLDVWVDLRVALWPRHTRAELTDEARAILNDPDQVCYLAFDPPEQAVGFAEAAVYQSPIGRFQSMKASSALRDIHPSSSDMAFRQNNAVNTMPITIRSTRNRQLVFCIL